jgi:hypothetical protein
MSLVGSLRGVQANLEPCNSNSNSICPPALPLLLRNNRYADPAVHRAYIQLLASRPDLSKACNGVILYGLCKCDRSTGLAAVKRLSELPEAWTNAARVNASAFLYQKVGMSPHDIWVESEMVLSQKGHVVAC